MKSTVLSLSIALFAQATLIADNRIRVTGHVLDESGRPVASATVADFWSANGTGKRPDGKPLDLKIDKEMRICWSHVGEMEPRVSMPALTAADGSFSFEFRDDTHTIIAMDPTRQRGGIATWAKGNETAPLTIRLGPLVRVRGRFEGPGNGQVPYWTHIYVMAPFDQTRPLHLGRLAHCGSFDARFEVALPPGSYILQGYSNDSTLGAFEGDLVPDMTIHLPADKTEVDLGTLKLKPHVPDCRMLESRAKADGTWYDYTKHFGEPAPQWHAADARGVNKNARVSDFKGKWLLLDFWGMTCRPCLGSGLPKLMKFYEDHSSQRDKFEILSICIDYDGGLKSMADVDRALAPIVKHVWNGKTLPFPILLDPTFETWQRFGIPGLGAVILIDPNGNLVRGDETTLAERLKENVAQSSSK
jgi:hypothetical protein